mgnify:CR=1 FL=1
MITEKIKLYRPVFKWIVTQRFGENALPLYKQLGMLGHNGIDVMAQNDWLVRSAHAGTVTQAGYDNSGGLGIVVTTDKMYNHHGIPTYFKTIYWHLKEGSLKIKVGDKVDIGTALALADNTGYSTGTHLHFGLKPVYKGEDGWSWYNLDPDNGYLGAIDPTEYLAEDFAYQFTSMAWLTEQINKLKLLIANYK